LAEKNDQSNDQQDQAMEGIEQEVIYVNADKYKCTLVIDKVKQPILDTAGILRKILTEKSIKILQLDLVEKTLKEFSSTKTILKNSLKRN
jgi:hypothetical protein